MPRITGTSRAGISRRRIRRRTFSSVEAAVTGNGKTTTPFDYSGPLTEAVLLGPLATRFPKPTLEWNSAKLKFANSPEANRYVRTKYRQGWNVKGL